MPLRTFLVFLSVFVLVLLRPSQGLAQLSIPDDSSNPSNDTQNSGGFAKPYEYERQAYGYDPEGVDYKENQPEDFQVIFITSLPFTTLASFGITGLVSLAAQGQFGVGGNYFIPFVVSATLGATTVACVSVLTNKYPPPESSTYVESPSAPQPLAFKVPILTMRF
ncbi:MAG TPA: hypothetical protein VK859_04075 [bacterium]|jgi:hypothetical protein|nr:hypothetical protein [bacterium]